ncbi:glycerate kinase [Infirmifilum lucidum]|uniref:Glycerate kinase n=1 Tax=Infirmifilum lucidum TaxID=2776706 RepID=A0A7L9FGH8_9CREN|nr:glycerate kinase [Infirmifilum lucidum]QOJ78412.1 glycerate kinase [Infirmifilum lucidum]
MDEREDQARVTALTLALEGIRSAEPRSAVKNYLTRSGEKLVLRDGTEIPVRGEVYVVGAGKASGGMAQAIEEILGDKIAGGVVSVPEELVGKYSTKKIRIVGATHPKASQKSVEAGRMVLETLTNLREDDLVIALFSGGGSALLEYPVEGVTIDEIGEFSILLMKRGADIFELNAVRKHLSRIKGGWLARHAQPARVLALMISDVVGDRMDTIASGPTVPDPTTFQDAYNILKKYSAWEEAPASVRAYIEKGLRGAAPETPKPDDPVFSRVVNRVIASNMQSLEAMATKAQNLGYRPLILTSMLEGEAREVGKVIASILREVRKSGKPLPPPLVILAGGETTVTVRGRGIGGRNQELALSIAIGIRGLRGVAVACIGSDGRDGPTDVAGAVVGGSTYDRAVAMGLKPEEFLVENNSYEFFRAIGGHIKTGYTGTNVNDFIVAVIEDYEM